MDEGENAVPWKFPRCFIQKGRDRQRPERGRAMTDKKTKFPRQIVIVYDSSVTGAAARRWVKALRNYQIQPGDLVLFGPDLERECEESGLEWTESMRPLMDGVCEVTGRDDDNQSLSVLPPDLSNVWNVPERCVRLCIRVVEKQSEV